MTKLTGQTASNVQANTILLEFWDEKNTHFAGVTRFDDTDQLKFNCYDHDIDVQIVEQMIQMTREKWRPIILMDPSITI